MNFIILFPIITLLLFWLFSVLIFNWFPLFVTLNIPISLLVKLNSGVWLFVIPILSVELIIGAVVSIVNVCDTTFEIFPASSVAVTWTLLFPFKFNFILD